MKLLIELLTALRRDPKPRLLEDHEVPPNGPSSIGHRRTPPPVPPLQAELEPEEDEFTHVWRSA